MNSAYGLLIGIYAAGAIVGLVCWLPYFFSARRWARDLLRSHREQHYETVAVYDRLVEVNGQLSGVQAKLDETTEQAARIDVERLRLRRTVSDLGSKVETLEAANVELGNDLAGLRLSLVQANQEVARRRGQVATLETDVERQTQEWSTERDSLKRSLAEAEATCDRLRSQIAAMEHETEHRIAEWAADRAGLEQSLAEEVQRVGELCRKIEESQFEHERATAEWSNRREVLEKSLEGATADAARLRREIEELEAERSTIIRERNENAAQIAPLQATIADRDQTLALSQAKIDRLTTDAKGLNSAIAVLEAQVFELSRGQSAPAPPKPDPGPNGQQPATIYTGSPRITIGLDFGTYSTKVVFRADDAQKSWVLRWDKPATGYPSFAAPSLVRMDQGCLFFGSKALQMREGRLFRSLKLDLLPVEDDGADHAAESDGTQNCVLVAVYMAWVLQNANAVLKVDPRKVSLNVGAPMKRAKDQALLDRYLHVVHAAWQLAFGAETVSIVQGVSYDDLVSRVRELLDRPVPPINSRRFEVFPETMCPIVSLSRDPKSWGVGMVMVIDMGAGTTEFSISSVADFDGNDFPIHCFCDESSVLGGDLFSDNDATAASLEAHREREQELVRQFLEKYEKVWKAGYVHCPHKLPMERKAWDHLRIIKVGGGLRRRQLENKLGELKQPPSINNIPDPKRTCHADWHLPTDLDFWDQYALEPIDHLPLLGVAHGLSIHRQHWPKIVYPDEIQRTERPEPIDKKPHEPWHNRA